MTPQKAKKYVNKISEDKNLDSMIVDDIVSFYYKKVKEALTTLKHSRVKLDNLGAFEIKEKTLVIEEERLNKQVEILDNGQLTFNKHDQLNQVNMKLEYISKLKSILKSEQDRMKEVIDKRKQYEKNKSNT